MTELKGYAMMQFSYMLLKTYGKGEKSKDINDRFLLLLALLGSCNQAMTHPDVFVFRKLHARVAFDAQKLRAESGKVTRVDAESHGNL
jgi:hypothetical protein